MNIKSQKYFFSGLMFMEVGVAFVWGATTYTVGTGARMGPGYLPLMLGVLFVILGGVVTLKALLVETEDGEKFWSGPGSLYFSSSQPIWSLAPCWTTFFGKGGSGNSQISSVDLRAASAVMRVDCCVET